MVSTTNRIAAYDDEPQAPAGDAPQADLPRVFWRRRWWILACVVICVAGSAAYHAKQVPLYRSSSRLYIQQNGPKILTDAQGLGVEQAISTQIGLIKSTPLLSAVADRPEIRALPIFDGVDNPVAFVKSGLTVSAEKEGDFVDIAFTSTDADASAQVANAVVDAYSTYMERQRQNTAAAVLGLLKEQKDARDAEFKQKLQESLEFKRDNGMLSFLDDKGNIITERLARLSGALTEAQIETIDAEAHAEWVRQLKDDPRRLLESARAEARSSANTTVRVDAGAEAPLPEVRDDVFQKQADELAAKVQDAEYALRAMEAQRTGRHYDVRRAEAELELVRQRSVLGEEQIARRRAEAQRRLEDLKAEHQSDRDREVTEQERELVEGYRAESERRRLLARQREEQLATAFEAQRKLAFDLNAVAAEAQSLDADLARLERATSALDDRIKEINVNEDTSVPNVHILEVARAADEPVNANLGRSLAMGLALGLMLGGGLAYGVDSLDQRIRSAEEVAAILEVPVLGMVPHIGGGEEGDFSRGRVAVAEPTSDVAEAYRTIRTAVQFALRDAQLRRVLVTSAAPGDGKSSTASNLALSMAQAGKRVLLVDADCRKPTQHKIFNRHDGVGLTSVLTRGLPVGQAVGGAGIAGVRGLDVLPCGPIPSNPAELINGQAFADLLDSFDGLYDLILIDSPPVAPVTDARILAALCDATIFVVKAERTTRKIAQHARESLRGVGAQLLGVVVNDVPRRRDRYGYYYGYGYGHRYYQYGYGEAPASPGRGVAPAAPVTPLPAPVPAPGGDGVRVKVSTNGSNGNGKHSKQAIS